MIVKAKPERRPMVFSEPELNAAFQRVENRRDWRGGIHATIRECHPGELNKIAAAVQFYTGKVARITKLHGMRYLVEAAGCREAV